MVNVMQTRWHDTLAGVGRQVSLPTSSGALEIQFRSDLATAEPAAVCRIIVMEPLTGAAQAASSAHASPSLLSMGERFRPGFADDEEPTWEDAAWQ